MLIGLVGAPNKGKSTLFSALTTIEVGIADYPFTTIKPNLGTTYFTKECPDKALGLKCMPRNSLCVNNIRRIPISITDIAGLVPGASLGKGMGNQFLSNIVGADALILVVDLTGETDSSGNKTQFYDPYLDIKMIREELKFWLSEIIKKHMGTLSKSKDGITSIKTLLSSFKATSNQVKEAAELSNLSLSFISWDDKNIELFSEKFLSLNKPMVIAANKLDLSSGKVLTELIEKVPDLKVIGCSAAIELALRKAEKSGVIEYDINKSSFNIKSAEPEQKRALDFISEYLSKHNGTGVQELINYVTTKLLKQIVAYPVENDTKYTDHFGNVLPDAILMTQGSTALDLASKIHTDLAEKMIYAIDARKKSRISKEYLLKDNDIIKIVSAAK
ncbi:MAG: YchF-related putative GTPase [Candidatus Micrarchaeia archaeon]